MLNFFKKIWNLEWNHVLHFWIYSYLQSKETIKSINGRR